MIESDGIWGLPAKELVKIKILNCLSDGEKWSSADIVRETGLAKDIVTATITYKKGIIHTFDIESERMDDPYDSRKMVTYYRWKVALRNCPWCNGTPVVHTYRAGDKDRHRVKVECKCGIATAPFKTKSEAIRKWNTRFGE